jgi:hypothetical protein
VFALIPTMKRSHFPRWFSRVALAAVGLWLTASPAIATDFSLQPREPGPGHRIKSYWWEFNKVAWELTPPEGFTLLGGGELRLEKTDEPALVAVCRQTTDAERTLFGQDDKKAQADYVRKTLPGGITDVRLISQAKNPLPVNGLTNFEVTYSYVLGGLAYKLTCMVSQGGEMLEQSPPVPGEPPPPPTPAPTPGADGKPVRTGEFFTTVVSAAVDRQPVIYGAFQQLMATARIKRGEPERDDSSRYSSHGMLGR